MTHPILALAPALYGDSVDWLAPISAAAELAHSNETTFAVVLLGADDAQIEAAVAAGADSLWLVSHANMASPPDADQIAHVYADVLHHPELAGFCLGLLPIGLVGDTLAAKLAMGLNGAVLGRCTEIVLRDQAVKAKLAAYGGRAQIELTSFSPCFAMKRPDGGTKPTGRSDAPRRINLSGDLPAPLPIQRRESGLKTPNLEGAKVVVSGGRGIGGEEGFVLLTELASCLGGALGGSLPTVDAGWVPVFRQVGQSGKFVTPDIYLAVGISGTPQHMAGIGSNTRIIAINKDVEADIFRFAETGIVADWREVLPDLIARLQAPGA